MKRLILMAFGLVLYSFVFAQDMPEMKMPMQKKGEKKRVKTTESGKPTNKVIYTCVMHPEVKMDKPGNCPKCNMKLVKKTLKVPAVKVISKKQDGMDMLPRENDKKMEGMGGMQMNDGNASMDNIKIAKKNLGSIKTITSNAPPRTIRYDLYIRDTIVTFGKKPKRAIAVNGQIPMPTLTFTEGDTAEIWVHNELNEVTSLHWHGLFLPNKMDGVPFLTQMPIKPHSSYLYKFPINSARHTLVSQP